MEEIGAPTHGDYHYVIRIDAHEYAELTRAVLNLEYSTSMAMRRAIAEAKVESGRYHGGRPYTKKETP